MKNLSNGIIIFITIYQLLISQYLVHADLINENSEIARQISGIIAKRLRTAYTNTPEQQNEKATLIPPIDDPAFLNPTFYPINISHPSLFDVEGYINLTVPTEVTGLSRLVDDFNLNLLTQTLTYDLDIPIIESIGQYAMDLNLNNGTFQSRVVGDGRFSASANNVFLKINGKLKIPIGNSPIGLSSLTLDMGFKNLKLDGGNATIDGMLIDWTSLEQICQFYFDTLWESERYVITEMIRCSLDDFVNECTVNDLVSGELDCLKTDLNPLCFGDPYQPSLLTTLKPIETTTVEISSTLPPRICNEDSFLLANTVSEAIITKFKSQIESEALSSGVKAPFLPPFDDPACLAPTQIPIDLKLPNLFDLEGYFNYTGPRTVTGLSRLVDDFILILLTQTLTYDLDIPIIESTGQYAMDLDLNMGAFQSRVIGDGRFSASANNIFLKIVAKLKIPIGNSPIGLSSLTLDMGFSDLKLDGGNATFDGVLIDWTYFGRSIQFYFDTLWESEESKLIITEMIRCSLDDFVNECTIAQLTAGDLDCLKTELNLSCFDLPTSQSMMSLLESLE